MILLSRKALCCITKLNMKIKSSSSFQLCDLSVCFNSNFVGPNSLFESV